MEDAALPFLCRVGYMSSSTEDRTRLQGKEDRVRDEQMLHVCLPI